LEERPYTALESQNDSILHNLTFAKDRTLPLPVRKKKINKALRFLNSQAEDSLFTEALYQKNLIHFGLQEYDSILENSHKLEQWASRAKQHKVLVEHYYLLGYYHAEIRHVYDSAMVNYSKSKEYALLENDSSKIALNLLNIGTIQKDQNDFFGSKETITEALPYIDPKRDSTSVAAAYNILATDHRKLLNFKDAQYYYQRAITTTPNARYQLIYKNNLAATFIDNEEYKKAVDLLRSISQDSVLLRNKKDYARVLDNLAYAQWRNGEAITATAFEKALKSRVQDNDRRGQIASYTHLGEYHSAGQPKTAMAYFDSVVQLSKKLKIPRAERDALKLVMGLKPTDVASRDRYVFLQDSLYAEELKVKTQFAKYKYDNTLKQASILRLEKENAQKELEAVKQRDQKILYLGGMFLSIFILSFAYFGFKQRSKRLKNENRTAKLEATYATEAELSRKLHDDFGGKLNHAMLLLQNGADTEDVLHIVDDLYGQSRDFSREINDVDTGARFKDMLLGMMGNYCQKTKLIITGSTEVDWEKVTRLSKKTVYKILQELMINMQKHSKASLVSVSFQQSKKHLEVQYTDNGIGASKEALHTKNGLWNTEKRIQAIGGSLIFDSEEGHGFEVRMIIPN
jgi:tetratricopeptide (TPR) repeat protein